MSESLPTAEHATSLYAAELIPGLPIEDMPPINRLIGIAAIDSTGTIVPWALDKTYLQLNEAKRGIEEGAYLQLSLRKALEAAITMRQRHLERRVTSNPGITHLLQLSDTVQAALPLHPSFRNFRERRMAYQSDLQNPAHFMRMQSSLFAGLISFGVHPPAS